MARAVPPYLRSVRTPRACHVMFMVYVRTWGRGRVRACRGSVCLETRMGACLCALLTSVPWVGRGLRRTSVSFLDVAPPLGPMPGAEVRAPYVGDSARSPVLALPCTHYTHWWPALQGGAGWVGSTGGDLRCVPALPTLQIGGNLGGVFSPISQWNPGLFLFFFQKSCPFWTLRFFPANGNCDLRFPPLDAGTSKVKLG